MGRKKARRTKQIHSVWRKGRQASWATGNRIQELHVLYLSFIVFRSLETRTGFMQCLIRNTLGFYACMYDCFTAQTVLYFIMMVAVVHSILLVCLVATSPRILIQWSGAGIMEADDRQVTTVFTVQPSFRHRHSTNRVSWSATIGRRTCSHTSPRRSPTMVTLHDTVCRVPMVEWRLDCENCRHLTVVDLHDTGSWCCEARGWLVCCFSLLLQASHFCYQYKLDFNKLFKVYSWTCTWFLWCG